MTTDWSQVSSLIVAIGTAALAIYAALTFKGLKSQMILLMDQAASMKRQADAMDKQSKFIKDQSDAMRSQAQTMEGQSSLMLKNMEYDRLTKKYDRIKREMDLLVGQLYARRNDDQLFLLQKHSERITYRRGSLNELTYDFVSFWESIDQNMYLNSSSDFKRSYDNYNASIEAYFNSPEQEKETIKGIFERTKKVFIRDIETRYKEISDKLNEIESELKIQDERKKTK